MGRPSQCCIQKLISFCWCRQVFQILMNPIDLEESIIQALLETGDEIKKVLPLNTNHKFKHFQTTLPKPFYVRIQSIQWWASKSAMTVAFQTASAFLLNFAERHNPKKSHPSTKCIRRCLSAQELEAVPPTAWTGKLPRQLHQLMNSHRAHYLSRNYKEVQHRIIE